MIGPEFPQVLSAAARGDEEAFGRLWHDMQPRVLRYFAVVSPAAAEDLASETWLGVVRGIERFRGGEPAFRAWVFTIARDEALDWRRRAARRPTEDLAVDGLMEQVASDDPAAAAVEGFSTRAALALVATLPADQAEAVVLRVVAGLDVDQVASLIGKRPGTVRVLTHRGAAPAGRASRRRRPDPEGGVTRWAPMTLPLLRCADYPSIRTRTRWPSTTRPSSGC